MITLTQLPGNHPCRRFLIGDTTWFATQADQRFSYGLHLPERFVPGTRRPVVVAVHSTMRRAQELRRSWSDFAEQNRAVIVTPLEVAVVIPASTPSPAPGTSTLREETPVRDLAFIFSGGTSFWKSWPRQGDTSGKAASVWVYAAPKGAGMSSNETPPQPAGSQNERGDNADEGERNAAPGKKGAQAGIWADWAQIAGTFIAAIAVIVAITVAIQGQDALKTSTQTAERQSEDSQLSTAITEIGSGGATGQITGLLLLAENASDRIINKSATGETPTEVYTYYNSALQVLSSYLSTYQGSMPSYPSSGNGSGKTGLPFGRGYGVPPGDGSPLNIKTAADQLVFLLSPGTEKAVAALTVSRPSIVLSDDELAGREWQYPVNLGWITALLASTDLRGTDLASSQWSETSDLSNSYLQCADLREANFRGADLAGADLRGADVQGADFIGANLNLAKVTQVYGTAKWPSWIHGIVARPADKWNQAACMQDSQFWDNAPRAGAASSKMPGKGAGAGGGTGSG